MKAKATFSFYEMFQKGAAKSAPAPKHSAE